MILLDTNVLSELMREQPDSAVVDWLDRQPRTSIWTSSVNVFEIRYGLSIMPEGKRQAARHAAFDHLLAELLQGRVAPFDHAAAQHAATLTVVRQRRGRLGELRDTMIAGIALAAHATLATRNVRHYEDISCPVINPWDPERPSPRTPGA